MRDDKGAAEVLSMARRADKKRDEEMAAKDKEIARLQEDNDRQNQQLLEMVAEAERLQKELSDADKEADQLRALLAKR